VEAALDEQLFGRVLDAAAPRLHHLTAELRHRAPFKNERPYFMGARAFVNRFLLPV
jgi:hypothetical protein